MDELRVKAEDLSLGRSVKQSNIHDATSLPAVYVLVQSSCQVDEIFAL